ncbi:MAG: Holliday junction resolvase RuvX [Acidimicrobiales bacterium]
MRALGLDLGAARIGVALSDSGGSMAMARDAILRSTGPADRLVDRQAIAELVSSTGAGVVVVGLPLSLDGRMGPAARAVAAEVDALRAALAVPVEVADERFSTVTARRALSAAGRPARRQRGVIDSAAAAVILQSWLDCRRRAGPGDQPGSPVDALPGGEACG